MVGSSTTKQEQRPKEHREKSFGCHFAFPSIAETKNGCEVLSERAVELVCVGSLCNQRKEASVKQVTVVNIFLFFLSEAAKYTDNSEHNPYGLSGLHVGFSQSCGNIRLILPAIPTTSTSA